jgi:hypothetical protein
MLCDRCTGANEWDRLSGGIKPAVGKQQRADYGSAINSRSFMQMATAAATGAARGHAPFTRRRLLF